MKSFLILVIIFPILTFSICGQDSIPVSANIKTNPRDKGYALFAIDKYVTQSIKRSIDFLDLTENNGPALSQNSFFMGLSSFLTGFGTNPGDPDKILNFNNPEINPELIDYAGKWDKVYPNDPTGSKKAAELMLLWKLIDGKSGGPISFEDYWDWAKKNISSFYVSVSQNVAQPIMQGQGPQGLKRDGRNKNRYICTYKAYIYLDITFAPGSNLTSIQPIDFPLDFKISLTIDKNQNPSGFMVEEIHLASVGDTIRPRNWRMNANMNGGYVSSKIDLDQPGIRGSYTSPGSGYNFNFSLDVDLLKSPQHRQSQKIVAGFMAGIGYYSTTFDYYLKGYQEKTDLLAQAPANLINLTKYNLVSEFNDIDQQTTLNYISVPVGLKLTYFTTPNKSVGIRFGLGLSGQFPMSINTSTRSGQVTYSAECTFTDNHGHYVDLTLDDDQLGYTTANAEIPAGDPVKLLAGINGFYSIGLVFTPGSAKRFGGFVQYSNSIPLMGFELQQGKSESGTLDRSGTNMNGQTENLLHFSNSFGLRNSVVQAGFFIKILSETR
jgi:hypothetical protein